MNSPDPVVPWYRQFWPWLIIGILGWGVLSSAITLTMAVSNPPQMMTGDYQRLGKLLVDTHERADRAEALGLSGRLESADGRWRLRLQALAPNALPARLLLRYQHPVDAALDRQLVLERASADTWSAPFVALPERGRIIVSDLEQRWWISSVLAAGVGRIELKPERL